MFWLYDLCNVPWLCALCSGSVLSALRSETCILYSVLCNLCSVLWLFVWVLGSGLCALGTEFCALGCVSGLCVLDV